MSNNQKKYSNPFEEFINNIKKEKFLYFLKLLIIVVLPTILLVFTQYLSYFLQGTVCRAEVRGGYGGLSSYTYIPAIDGPESFNSPYQYGIPFVTAFFKAWYFTPTNTIWALSAIFIFIFYGQKMFYRYIEFCFIWFFFFDVIAFIHPTFNVLSDNFNQSNPKYNDYINWLGSYTECPSGHGTVIYLPIFFLFKKNDIKKHWYHYTFNYVYLTLSIVTALSTWFYKQHYFLDIILTSLFIELVGLLMFFIHKKHSTNYMEFIFRNLNQLLLISTKSENQYTVCANKIEIWKKNKILVSILWIATVSFAVGLIVGLLLFMEVGEPPANLR